MMPLRTHGTRGIHVEPSLNTAGTKSTLKWLILRVVDEKAPSGRPIDGSPDCKGDCQPKSPRPSPTRSPSASPDLPLNGPCCVRHVRNDRVPGASDSQTECTLGPLTLRGSIRPASNRQFGTRRAGSSRAATAQDPVAAEQHFFDGLLVVRASGMRRHDPGPLK